MGLAGQERGERGYAMAALLIALAVMAIVMSVAMPVWRHEAQREKEAELIFRGEQYARAIALFRFKNAQNPTLLPPSIDVLVDGRFLRKKYKDPMTKDGEFVPVQFGQQTPGAPGRQGQGQPGQPPAGRGAFPPPQPPLQPQQPGGQTMAIGGIAGVRSKSQETSIRSYRGQTRYDQWLFLATNTPRPGGAMPATNTPDGRGNNPPTFPGSNTGPRGTGPRGTGPRGNPPGGINPPGGFNPPGTGFPQPPGRRGGGGPGGRGPGQ
jgi:type II secretory pathway pseudopilin PulG